MSVLRGCIWSGLLTRFDARVIGDSEIGRDLGGDGRSRPGAKQVSVGHPTDGQGMLRQLSSVADMSWHTRWSAMGQCTKSLRDSPLRGGNSREAVASREESDSESTRSPRSTSLLLQRSTLDQAHQVDLRPVSDAAMARCWNDKIGLDE